MVQVILVLLEGHSAPKTQTAIEKDSKSTTATCWVDLKNLFIFILRTKTKFHKMRIFTRCGKLGRSLVLLKK